MNLYELGLGDLILGLFMHEIMKKWIKNREKEDKNGTKCGKNVMMD